MYLMLMAAEIRCHTTNGAASIAEVRTATRDCVDYAATPQMWRRDRGWRDQARASRDCRSPSDLGAVPDNVSYGGAAHDESDAAAPSLLATVIPTNDSFSSLSVV